MIDAHLHYMGDHAQTMAIMESLDLKLFNITVALTQYDWRKVERDPYRELARQWPERFAWCTSFELPETGRHDPAYAARVIAELDQDFEDGALACKIWKNFGMELKDEHGEHVLMDSPVLTPIYEYLQDQGRPLLVHTAEPMECWLPLNPQSAHYPYYSKNPQWHMHGRTDVPSHARLMVARDNVLERYPKLRMIGAHLGSMEYDLKEIARRLDKYPNFAVDNSSRLLDMVQHDRDELRAFMIKYADRILYGTDVIEHTSHSQLSSEERQLRCNHFAHRYKIELEYFSTPNTVQLLNKKSYRGLELPKPVLQQFMNDNARAWYPGL